jgi:hypothetical protein
LREKDICRRWVGVAFLNCYLQKGQQKEMYKNNVRDGVIIRPEQANA